MQAEFGMFEPLQRLARLFGGHRHLNSVAALHDAVKRCADPHRAISREFAETTLFPLMACLDARDLGVDRTVAEVVFVPIVETATYSIGLFVLPPHAVIPLHDHPNMTVLSRLVRGSLRVRSFDWVDGTRSRALPEVLLRAPANTALYPSECNVHEFIAGEEGSAILDVISPPYNSTSVPRRRTTRPVAAPAESPLSRLDLAL
mmetsp:Transcript_7349/g.23950  ORF Transcript_7349/g.23950 Transcript_7349/m.23950 type:complete len:203 (+) Transcript_7349:42-650(+)